MSRTWSRWAEVLAIVRPETVIAWHRRGFARFWTRKSRRAGRPPLAAETVLLIEQMAPATPTDLGRHRCIVFPTSEPSEDVAATGLASPPAGQEHT
jgi:hypothetical protein